MGRAGSTEILKLKDRYARLESDRWPYLLLWMELADYIIPRKANISDRYAAGQKMTDKLRDPTAVHANELLAASMAGTLSNKSTRWFALKCRREELNEIKAVADWLDDSTERMYYALAQSNFYSEIHEVYLDLGAFGTGAILIDTDRKTGNLQFGAQFAGEFCVAEDGYRRVDTVFRKPKMTARQIVQRWPGRASSNVARGAASSEKDQRFDVMHCIYPREGGRTGRGVLAEDMTYASLYFEWDSGQILEESGYQEWPIPVPRWTKSTGETYGRGPGHTALPLAKTLNATTEQKLMAGILQIRPPLLSTQNGVIGKVSLRPAAINTIAPAIPGQMNPPLQPLLTGANIRPAELLEAPMQQQIHQIYFSDLLNLPEDGQQMTAREVMIRHERMQQALGPTLGRLEDELFNPTIERVFGIMMRSGRLAPPPRELVDVMQKGDGTIDIEYQGPLARAQRSSDTLAIERWTDWRVKMAVETQDMSLLDVMDMDEAGWHSAEVTGVPSKVMRSKDQVGSIRDGRAQAAEKQKAIEDRLAGAQEMKDKAPYMKALSEGKPGIQRPQAIPEMASDGMM
jgi:hypothetical protein